MLKPLFVQEYRAAVTRFQQAADDLANLRAYYDSQNLGALLTDSDIPVTGEGVTIQQFIDGIAAADAAIAATRTTPLQLLRERL